MTWTSESPQYLPERSSKFIFIGGAPRSGTSLVQKVLGLHQAIYAGPEFDHLPRLVGAYNDLKASLESGRQRDFFDAGDLKTAFAELIERLLAARALACGKTLISEKTPGNVAVFSSIAELFPEAKFVVVVRDPRAVISSLQKVRMRALTSAGANALSHRLIDNLRLVDAAVEAGEAFVASHPSQCHLVPYEDLVQQPDETVRKLTDFLEIDYCAAMLDTAEPNASSNNPAVVDGVWYTREMYDRPITAASATQWQQDLDARSISITSDFFARKDYRCHRRYQLQPCSGLLSAWWKVTARLQNVLGK